MPGLWAAGNELCRERMDLFDFDACESAFERTITKGQGSSASVVLSKTGAGENPLLLPHKSDPVVNFSFL